MSNFLDMRCPNCGSEDELDIQARLWIRVGVQGTNPDLSFSGDQEYEPDSAACCNACGHAGTVAEFEQAGSVQ